MDSKKRSCIGVSNHILVLIFFVVLLCPSLSMGQGCPSFEIEKIQDTGENQQLGSVEITIKSSKTFSVENFDILQKTNRITAPLGYTVSKTVSGNRLTIEGLRKSEEMYLEEYVVRFSDQACNNGKVLEAGVFKIK